MKYSDWQRVYVCVNCGFTSGTYMISKTSTKSGNFAIRLAEELFTEPKDYADVCPKCGREEWRPDVGRKKFKGKAAHLDFIRGIADDFEWEILDHEKTERCEE